MRAARHIAGMLAAALLLATAVRAQDAGTIAELEGDAQIRHGGVTSPAAIGAALAVGDVIVTGGTGRLHVVLRDDSVLAVGVGAEVAIVQLDLAAPRRAPRTRLRLVRGAIRVVVGSGYGERGALFEVETGTAVARVRGTEFVVAYDPVADVSEVVGVNDTVAVYSVLDRTTRGVVVRAQEITTVARGQYPTPPLPLTETVFRQYLDNLSFIGEGRSESLTVGDPLFAGALVPEPDRAGAVQTGGLGSEFGLLAPADPWPPNRIEQWFPGFPGPFDQSGPGVEQFDRGNVGVEF